MIELWKQTLLNQVQIMLPLVYWLISFSIWNLLLIYLVRVFRDRKWIDSTEWQTEIVRERFKKNRQTIKSLEEEVERLQSDNALMRGTIQQIRNVIFYCGSKKPAIESEKKKKQPA